MTTTDANVERVVVRWHGLRAGPLLMVLAGLSFTLMVTLVKLARQELSTLDVVFWRGAVAVPLTMLLASRVSWRPVATGLLALRVGIGFLAMLCYFYAAKGLAITDQTLLGKLQPLVIAALAPVFLGRKEGADPGGWLLIGLGMTGTVILIAPELQVGSWFGAAALAATVFSALAHLCIRKLTATDKPVVIVLWYQVFITIASAVLLLGLGASLPPVHLWLHLAGIGALAVTGQMLMTYAYRADRAPLVATAGYTTPIWAVLVDLVVWGVLPTWTALIGGILVVVAGLLLLVRRG